MEVYDLAAAVYAYLECVTYHIVVEFRDFEVLVPVLEQHLVHYHLA